MSSWLTFSILVLVQTAIAVAVVLVLKKLLNKELIESALEKFTSLKTSPDTTRLEIHYAAPLNPAFQERFKLLAQRKFTHVALVWQEDKSLKGGVVLIVGNETFDFSITNRLRHFWS